MVIRRVPPIRISNPKGRDKPSTSSARLPAKTLGSLPGPAFASTICARVSNVSTTNPPPSSRNLLVFLFQRFKRGRVGGSWAVARNGRRGGPVPDFASDSKARVSNATLSATPPARSSAADIRFTSTVGGWFGAGFRQRFKGSHLKCNPLRYTARAIQRRLNTGQRAGPASRSPNPPRPVSGHSDGMVCDMSPEASAKLGRRHGKNGQGAESPAVRALTKIRLTNRHKNTKIATKPLFTLHCFTLENC